MPNIHTAAWTHVSRMPSHALHLRPGSICLAISSIAMAISVMAVARGLPLTGAQVSILLRAMIAVCIAGLGFGVAGIVMDERRWPAIVGMLLALTGVVFIPLAVM